MPTINGDQSVTAVFYQVELTVTKTGEGEVTTTPYGNTEEPTFTEKYAPDEPVVLKAVPEDGWFFVGWSGAVTSASSTVQIDMTEDKAVHTLDSTARDVARAMVKALLDRFPVYPQLDLGAAIKAYAGKVYCTPMREPLSSHGKIPVRSPAELLDL